MEKDTIPSGVKRKNKVYLGSEYYSNRSDYEKMIAACSALDERVLVRLLESTGGRRFEIAEMRIELFDFENRKYQIDRGKGGDKNATNPEKRRSRPVNLSKEAMADLKLYFGKRISGWVFLSSHKGKGHINVSTINRRLAQIAQAAGVKSSNPDPRIKNFYPHLFRHGFGRKPITLEARQKLLGHRHASTTMQLYGKKTFEDAQKEADAAEELQKNQPHQDTPLSKLESIEKKCHELGIFPKDYIALLKAGKL